ncbi:glycosyltransferase, partial [Actinoplanes sp. RD1]|uniref:glycosyltransferase n=1 Tax=Actinoplanes sp. RD1 TaxID=3064538 RepID=UPI002741E18E
APVAAATGLPVVPVGADVDVPALVRGYADGAAASAPAASVPAAEPGGRRAPRALAMVLALAEAMAPELLVYARRFRPDLVVFETTSWAGPVVAGALGVPSTRFLYGVDLLYAARDLAAGLLEPLTAQLGAPAARVLGDLVLDPAPEGLRLPVGYQAEPVRYVPYNGAGADIIPPLPPRGTRPRVCVTWGTTMSKLGPERFLAAEAGRAVGTDAEIVYAVSTAQASRLGPLPPGATVLRDVPLHLLLDSCDAVVHHGGAGTMLTALTAGLPQVLVPQLPDHATHARLLAASGAGLVRTVEEARSGALREAAGTLLGSPAHGAAARRLRGEMDAHRSPAELVPVLEKLAGK